MTPKRQRSEIAKDRRQTILAAAEELFAQNGYKGTTTKAVAVKAGVHEAILFRHFTSKQELYRTMLETKLARNRPAALEQMAKCAQKRDDRGFFEALANGLLARFEGDLPLLRLILYSALDGYEQPDVVAERQLRVEQPTLDYISKRIREGAFRKMDPSHAVFAFGAMLFGYVIRQHIVGMTCHKAYKREKIAQSFVTIFLEGLKA
jgi:TetR/AcrR family transcriptional regulator